MRHMTCERLYFGGDIVDVWKMKRGLYWPQTHTDVVQKILRLACERAVVTYISRNHDDRVRDFRTMHFGGLIEGRDALRQKADGRRFLVVHEDEFDAVVRHAAWVGFAGDLACRTILALSTTLNSLRRPLGFGYWSLSAFLKSKVKNDLKFIDRFEHLVAGGARRRNLNDVICGHIHKAEMREIGGVIYINDGDRLESCTAPVEHSGQRLEILHWADLCSWSMIDRTWRVNDTRQPRMEPWIA